MESKWEINSDSTEQFHLYNNKKFIRYNQLYVADLQHGNHWKYVKRKQKSCTYLAVLSCSRRVA